MQYGQSGNEISVSQDNYGRWFVEVRQGARKRAPIRCMSESEAIACAALFAAAPLHERDRRAA